MKKIIEALAGLFVLLVAGFFVFFAYKSADLKNRHNNYSLIAKFSQADGLTLGSDVRVSGVKVGYISSEYLDLQTYKAVVELSLDRDLKLPVDSSAQIVSDGLLGAKYLSIAIGGDDKMLENGNEIKFTQSSVNIESLIGKMIFNNSDNKTTKQ